MHTQIKQILIGAIILILLTACNRKAPVVSFYYWRTAFELSDVEKNTLKNNDVSKLYVRYFDVVVSPNGLPYPESPIQFIDKPNVTEIIPVVYIKNAVMLQDTLKIEVLAKQIFNYINQINQTANIPEPNEIQLDCDWTLDSRDKFMQFVDTFKQISGKQLSATIRLHQVKHYIKTGIPNVDRGVLMYYNMGKIAPDTLNSIYDRKIASGYIKSLKKYPLDLNVALPIFSWGVHVSNHKVVNLISKIDRTAFENDTNFYLQPNSNIIKVKNSNIKQNRYYLRNDWIKIEEVAINDLHQMYSDIKKNMRYKPEEIIFYDLNEININRYKNENKFFKEIVHCR